MANPETDAKASTPLNPQWLRNAADALPPRFAKDAARMHAVADEIETEAYVIENIELEMEEWRHW